MSLTVRGSIFGDMSVLRGECNLVGVVALSMVMVFVPVVVL